MATSRTWRKTKTLQDTVTSAEESAGQKIIFIGTGVPTVATSAFVYNLNILRGGTIDVTNLSKHSYNSTSGCVVVQTNNSSYVLTTGDVISISGTYL
jgi:hypothetical protein